MINRIFFFFFAKKNATTLRWITRNKSIFEFDNLPKSRVTNGAFDFNHENPSVNTYSFTPVDLTLVHDERGFVNFWLYKPIYE